MINGLGMTMGNMSRLSNAVTRSISAENFTGEKGRGGMATEGDGLKAARELGQKWKVSPCITIKPGEETDLCDIQGAGAIQSMWFAGYVGRDFILRMYWDDQEHPSVEVPLNDFFAIGWMDNHRKEQQAKRTAFVPVNSLPICVNPNNGLNSFFEMPFRSRARVTIENMSGDDKQIFYQINYVLTDVPDDAAYFHAQFRMVKPITAGEDYTIIDGIEGKGHYVGTVLHVGLNGDGNWWGEGELKFFIDGDSEFPTICGTGTEDYFGGAYDWDVNGSYTTYSTPFMGMHQLEQPNGLYNIQPRFSMYRWHVVDPIRFESDFKVTVQDLGWRSEWRFMPRRDDFYSVAYWYQTLPTKPFPKLPSRNEMEII